MLDPAVGVKSRRPRAGDGAAPSLHRPLVDLDEAHQHLRRHREVGLAIGAHADDGRTVGGAGALERRLEVLGRLDVFPWQPRPSATTSQRTVPISVPKVRP